MATVQKWKLGQANTLVGTQTVVGTLYPVNSKLHVITVNAGGSTTATTPRGNIIPDSGYTGGVIESIIDEVAPLAYWTTDSTVADQANIFVITDPSVHADDLQHRVRQIGANTAATRLTGTTFTYANTSIISAGGNSVDVSGTQVIESPTVGTV